MARFMQTVTKDNIDSDYQPVVQDRGELQAIDVL
jgi:hypothetical protein